MNRSTCDSLAVRTMEPGLSICPTLNGSQLEPSAYCADPRMERTTALPISPACVEEPAKAPMSATTPTTAFEKLPSCFIKFAPGFFVVTRIAHSLGACD